MLNSIEILLVGSAICLLSQVEGVTYNSNGCPVVQFANKYMKVLGDSCYEFVVYKNSAREHAEKYCKGNGGILTTINNDGVEKFIKTTLNNDFNIKSGSIWIGLNDIEEEGHFRWADGTFVGKYNELDHTNEFLLPLSGLSRDCVIFKADTGKWETRTCSYNILVLLDTASYPFICEYSNRASHIVPTTTRCPPLDCHLVCFNHGYVLDTVTGCNKCQCVTVPTTTTVSTTPSTTPCPTLPCTIGCPRYGYKSDPITGCRLCECQ